MHDLEALANEAKTKAYCPKSNHPVGCAGIGRSGAVYLGCNVELPHATQHAEQVMLAQAALAVDVIERVCLTCSPCGNCRQALYEHNLMMGIKFEGMEHWCSDFGNIEYFLREAYQRKNDYAPPAYAPHENPLIDAANKALSTCQAYRSGVAEACAIEAFDRRIFAAARNEWCSYPGDAFTMAFGAMAMQGRMKPHRVHWAVAPFPGQQEIHNLSKSFLPVLMAINEINRACKIVVRECRQELVVEWSPIQAFTTIYQQEMLGW